MMKRLLFSAISALFAFSANAEVKAGDYVYTPGGRYLLDELKTELTLDAELTGWKSINDNSLDNFQVVDGYVSAVTAANTNGLYRSFTVDNNDKTYVVVFDAKANEGNIATSFTPKFLGNAGDHIAHLNVYATDGEYVSTATAAATVSAQADLGLGFQLTSEYQTYAAAITNGGADLTWFIELSQLLDGISIGNIQVYEATQVYDNRFLQNKIDYLNAIINVYDWESMDKTPAQTNLWNFIKAAPEDLNGMADIISVEDGTTMVNAVNDSIVKFCGTFFGDYATEKGIRFQDGGTINIGDKKTRTNPIAGWSTTQRWGHTKGNANLNFGNYAYAWGNTETVTQKLNLSAGSYVFALDAYMNAVGKKNTVNAHTNGYYTDGDRTAICRGELTLSVLNENDEEVYSGKIVPLDNQVYQTGVVAFNIPQGMNGDYTFKIFVADTYKEKGYTTDSKTCLGGNGYLNDLRIFFKPAGKYDAAQIAYIEKVREQIAAMRDQYNKSLDYMADEEGKYYWYKWALEDTIPKYGEYLEFYEALTDDDIIEGYTDPASADAKAAAEAEGIDVSGWDCETSYAKYINMVPYTYYEENPETQEMEPKEGTRREVNAIDSIMNRAVRPVKRVNERFVAFNQHILDCQDAIASAYKALNTRVFKDLQGYDVLNGDVAGAEETLEGLLEDPMDYETLVAYAEAVDETTDGLDKSLSSFYGSGFKPGSEPTPIKKFDFENGTFALDDPETDLSTGTYTGAETDNGVMTISKLHVKAESAIVSEDGKTAYVPYSNGIVVDGAWTNTGVLRVGVGDATVALDEGEMVSGTNALHVSYDFYYGNLSGKSAGVYLKDAEGNNVAGIWGSKYDNNWLTTAYNPFRIDGNTDFSGVGSSSASNLAIVAESNKTHFDFYFDYGTKEMFVILNNAKQGTVNKRFDAVMEYQNPVASFVLNSDYNNNDRRCWFDNLVFEKITLGATSIKDAQSAAATAVKPAKRIINGQIVIEKNGKFFDAVGKRIK